MVSSAFENCTKACFILLETLEAAWEHSTLVQLLQGLEAVCEHAPFFQGFLSLQKSCERRSHSCTIFRGWKGCAKNGVYSCIVSGVHVASLFSESHARMWMYFPVTSRGCMRTHPILVLAPQPSKIIWECGMLFRILYLLGIGKCWHVTQYVLAWQFWHICHRFTITLLGWNQSSFTLSLSILHCNFLLSLMVLWRHERVLSSFWNNVDIKYKLSLSTFFFFLLTQMVGVFYIYIIYVKI